MLYDPKWEEKTKTTQPSLLGLIAWLETQPPSTRYDWYSCGHCVVGEYISDAFGEAFPAGAYLYHQVIAPHYKKIAECRPWTFGAALKRARAVL